MKYIIRRTVLGIVTVPIALAGYAIIYFGIGLLATAETASIGIYLANCWSVAIAWVLVVAFARQLIDLVDKVVA